MKKEKSIFMPMLAVAFIVLRLCKVILWPWVWVLCPIWGPWAAALQIAKKQGKVQWKDIAPDMYFLNFNWVGAEGFNTNSSEAKAKFSGMTMKEYLHYLWNNPARGQSPYKIFGGVLVPDG